MAGERMEREIREQIELLPANTGRYFEVLRRSFAGFKPELVVLAARGSSDNAALYARYLIEVHLGIPVSLSAPSVITRYGSVLNYPRALVVGISQSGAAPDVAEVLEVARSSGHRTLAITNTPDSHVGDAADTELLLGVGLERSVAATKTYSSSLLALYQLVRALGASLPYPQLPNLDWMEICSAIASEHSDLIRNAQPLFVLGRGYSFATACEGALKLMECALVPAKAYSSADFAHGPKALAGHGSAILAFGEIPKGLEDQGPTILEAPEPPGVPEEMLPVWQALYAQELALAMARARGLDPDRPRFLQKVTRTT